MRDIFLFFTFLFSSCTYNNLTVDDNTECIPDPQVFSSNIKPILDIYCVSCHYQGSGRSLLTDYTSVVSSIENDNLLFWLTSKQMPPPNNLPVLSDQDRQVLTNWIICE